MNNNSLGSWRQGRLGDEALTEINYGKANPRKEGNIPVIGSSGVYDSTDEPLVDAPSILIGRKGNAGSIQLIQEPCWPSDTTFYLKLKSKKLDYNFLSEYLTYRKLSSKKTQTTLPSLSIGDLRYLRIPIPPLVEQRGIVEVLGTVDECIRLTDVVIERAEELKRGLMQQLLTRGIGHTEYKETKLGEIPKLWNIKKIKKACEKPQYGYTASANEKPIGPKFLRITDIKDGLVNWAEVPFCECNTNDYNKYKIKKGDIVFARTGATTGKSYLIKHDVDAIFASYLIRLIAKDDVDPRFLYIFFNSELYWKQIRQRMVGSAQGGVNAAVLSNLDLPFPDKKEQSKIADIIFEVESNISHEKKKKELFINLKRGLMQQLLSGKIRVELKGDGLHRIGDSREANN